jgi:hypothetical protein
MYVAEIKDGWPDRANADHDDVATPATAAEQSCDIENLGAERCVGP